MAVHINRILKLRPADHFKMVAKLKRNQQIRRARNSLFRPDHPLDNYINGRKRIDPVSFCAKQWRLHSLKTPISFKEPLITAQFARK